MNTIIWFLTDTDFKTEWKTNNIYGKFKLLYVTGGLLFCEALSFLFLIELIF